MTGSTALVLVILLAIAVAFARLLGGKGVGSLPVRARDLMTRRERSVRDFIEAAVPGARVHAQVSMGAILAPRGGLDRSRATSVRNRFSSKRVDFLLEDRASGRILALVELDDRTHDRAADAQRDRMTARAGYRTIRLPAGRHTHQTVRQILHAGLGAAAPGLSGQAHRFTRNERRTT